MYGHVPKMKNKMNCISLFRCEAEPDFIFRWFAPLSEPYPLFVAHFSRMGRGFQHLCSFPLQCPLFRPSLSRLFRSDATPTSPKPLQPLCLGPPLSSPHPAQCSRPCPPLCPGRPQPPSPVFVPPLVYRRILPQASSPQRTERCCGSPSTRAGRCITPSSSPPREGREGLQLGIAPCPISPPTLAFFPPLAPASTSSTPWRRTCCSTSPPSP